MKSRRLSLLLGLSLFGFQVATAQADGAKSHAAAKGSESGTRAHSADFGGHHMQERLRRKLMEHFDRNGDGKLDEAELASAKMALSKWHTEHHQAQAEGDLGRIELLEQMLQQLGSSTPAAGNSNSGSGNGNGGGSDDGVTSAGAPAAATNPTSTRTPAQQAAAKLALERHLERQLHRAEERHLEHELLNGAIDHELKRDLRRQEARHEARHAAFVKKFDKNGDGKLDASERQAAKTAIQAHHQANAMHHQVAHSHHAGGK